MPIIEAEHLTKTYFIEGVENLAVRDISFTVNEGEFVAIMGPSGSGKSTLMHILGFLDRPTVGIYKFEGKRMDEYSDDELAHIRNQRMGFVFQSFNLLARASVFDNVARPLVYAKVSAALRQDIVNRAIKSVSMEHRINYFSAQLSGGEKQRVAIARALVNNPKVIFADEPTGNLDSRSGGTVMEILYKLNSEGHTIILVTHEMYTAQYASRIIHIKDGQLEREEKVAQRHTISETFQK